MDCESRARESRGFTRNNDKPRNDDHVNMVGYGSELSDDEEVNMCVAEVTRPQNINHSYALA
jgi:hypothetical protein